MTIMMMVEVTVDEIADVVAMWNSFVSTIFAVNVTFFMTFARMSAALESMLVYVVTMLIMEVPIMKVISVIAVLNRSVSAAGAMFVIVIVMCLTVAHYLLR
jgi:hypothetical protein